jgi:hypothetical protein
VTVGSLTDAVEHRRNGPPVNTGKYFPTIVQIRKCSYLLESFRVPSNRLWRQLGLLVAAAIVAAVTLLPGDSLWRSVGLHYCLACGSLRGAGAILNVALFVPVGFSLRFVLGASRTALVAGCVIALGIEALQGLLIAGRTLSLEDFLANAAGTATGVWLATEAPRLVFPGQTAARRYGLASGVFFGAVIFASAGLIRPAPLPPEQLFGQWTPRRPNLKVFSGEILSFAVGRFAVPPDVIPEAESVRAAWQRPPVTVSLETRGRGVEEPGLAGIARIVARDKEVLFLLAAPDAFVTRLRVRGVDWGLRPLMVRVPTRIEDGDQVAYAIRIERGELAVTVVASAGTAHRSVSLNPSLGWIFVLPFELAVGPWLNVVSAVWLGLWSIPAGYFARASATSSRKYANALAWPVALVAGSLGLAPAAFSVSSAPWVAWLGVALGLAVGWFGAATVERGRA